MLTDGMAENGDVRIEFRSNHTWDGARRGGVLFVPGVLGNADSFRDELLDIAPTPGISISLRGRGRSDVPRHEYAFTDQVNDLQAVFDSVPMSPVVVVGYSVGVPIALEFAVRNRSDVGGVMVIDYPARYPVLSEAWVERALASESGKGHEVAIRGLRETSKETLLWARIRELTCPVLIIRGEPSCGGLLKDEDLARYLEALPQAQIVAFTASGHDIWNPDKDRYLTTMREFVRGVLRQ